MSKPFWKAYQESDNASEAWKPVQAAAAAQIGSASHMAVLETEYACTAEIDRSDMKYRGPMAIDIDAQQIEHSIHDFKSLLHVLAHKGVDLNNLRLYASGKKGFHIVIPEVLFGDNEARPRLPLIYRHVAEALSQAAGITSIDWGQYNLSRGSLLRVENRQRKIGTFKVPLTAEEAMAITPELYAEYVKTPRTVTWVEGVERNGYLEGLFGAGKKNAEYVAKFTKRDKVESEALERLGEEVPRCIQWLTTANNLRDGVNFNAKAMQLAGWINGTRCDSATQDKTLSTFVTENKSSAYKSERERRANLNSAISAGVQFSCKAIRNVLAGDPCQSCPVRDTRREIASKQKYLAETMQGYVRQGGGPGSEIPISNFIIEPTIAVVPSLAEPTRGANLLAIVGNIVKNGEVVSYGVEFESSLFSSVANFQTFVQPFPGEWIGTVADLQALWTYLCEAYSEINRMADISTYGLHWLSNPHEGETKGEYEAIWVEPGWSKTKYVANSHRYSGDTPASLRSMQNTPPARGDDPAVTELLLALVKSNEPDVVAMCLGWSVACHLAPHIRATREIPDNGFPLLNLYGPAGAGKTRTACMYAAIGGADYFRGASPIMVGSATPLPLKRSACSTFSVPVIWDECNWSKMSKSRADPAMDVLKAVWAAEEITTGALSSGQQKRKSPGVVLKFQATAPIIYIATQHAPMQELRHRSLEVRLKEYDRDAFAAGHAPWHTVDKHREKLHEIARLLLNESLHLDPETVGTWVHRDSGHAPSLLESRTRQAFGTALCGLWWLAEVLTKHKFDSRVIDAILQKREELIQWLVDNAPQLIESKNQSETGKIIQLWSDQVAYYAARNASLSPGIAYMTMGDTLWLNIAVLWPIYLRHLRDTGLPIEMTESTQFVTLMQGERPFISWNVMPDGAVTGRWLALSRAKLQERGVDISGFM